jgi:hypothetical protein
VSGRIVPLVCSTKGSYALRAAHTLNTVLNTPDVVVEAVCSAFQETSPLPLEPFDTRQEAELIMSAVRHLGRDKAHALEVPDDGFVLDDPPVTSEVT